jgi:hypothetical protein
MRFPRPVRVIRGIGQASSWPLVLPLWWYVWLVIIYFELVGLLARVVTTATAQAGSKPLVLPLWWYIWLVVVFFEVIVLVGIAVISGMVQARRRAPDRGPSAPPA